MKKRILIIDGEAITTRLIRLNLERTAPRADWRSRDADLIVDAPPLARLVGRMLA